MHNVIMLKVIFIFNSKIYYHFFTYYITFTLRRAQKYAGKLKIAR